MLLIEPFTILIITDPYSMKGRFLFLGSSAILKLQMWQKLDLAKISFHTVAAYHLLEIKLTVKY